MDAEKSASTHPRGFVAHRRRAHYELAARIASDLGAAKVLVVAAMAEVARWRERGTYSVSHIEQWEELLRLPPAELAVKMLGFGGEESRLFQCSPFASELFESKPPSGD